MIPYYLLIIFILILQLKFNQYSKRQFSLFLAILILFMFAALRGNGNGDYFNYLSYSKLVTSFGDVLYASIPMEIGFRLIAYFVNSVGLHQQMVIAIMNFISLTCIFLFIKKYSPDKLLSVFLFLPLYFQFDMHTARTAVAIGIGTLGLKYAYENKLLKFIFVVILASCFHQSALILFLVYFIRNIKIRFSKGIIFLFLIVIFTELISIDKLVVTLLNLIGLNSISNRYLVYTQSSEFGYPYNLYDPRLILLILILATASYILKNTSKLENLFVNYLWINIFIIVIFRDNTAFVSRFSSYYNVYTIILVPIILYRLKQYSNESLYRNSSINEYHLFKLSVIYIYSLYIISLLIGAVDYKLFFL